MNLNHPSAQTEPAFVRRFVSFPLSSFDYLKGWQRDYSAKHGEWLDNGQALAVILREHEAQTPLNNGRGVRQDDRSNSR